jgi:predicted adenylyl cyclase CyaB
MPASIEFKAKLADLESAHATARTISGTEPEILCQTDVFFPCARGRLKLRILDDDHGELIFYQRSDAAGPCRSNYQIARTSDPHTLREILQQVSASLGTVETVRSLYMAGQTRIHLDQVKHLGGFLEIEVVLDNKQSDADGIHIAHALAKEFGITESQMVHIAYVDLLRKRLAPCPKSRLLKSPWSCTYHVYCGFSAEVRSRNLYTNRWISRRSRSTSSALLLDICS